MAATEKHKHNCSNLTGEWGSLNRYAGRVATTEDRAVPHQGAEVQSKVEQILEARTEPKMILDNEGQAISETHTESRGPALKRRPRKFPPAVPFEFDIITKKYEGEARWIERAFEEKYRRNGDTQPGWIPSSISYALKTGLMRLSICGPEEFLCTHQLVTENSVGTRLAHGNPTRAPLPASLWGRRAAFSSVPTVHLGRSPPMAWPIFQISSKTQKRRPYRNGRAALPQTP